MKLAATGLVMAVVLVACSGSDTPTIAPASPTTSSPSPIPAVAPLPSPSGGGFCSDQPIVDDVIAVVYAGDEPYRRAAAFVNAAEKVMRGDADSAPTARGANKIRQFALVLNTLRLAILGAAANYPGDFAVRQFTNSLRARAAKIAQAVNCPA